MKETEGKNLDPDDFSSSGFKKKIYKYAVLFLVSLYPSIQMVRVFLPLVAFIGLALALPVEQLAQSTPTTDSSTPAPRPTNFQHPSYNTQGLPESIFPDYSDIELGHTDGLHDVVKHMEMQNNGHKF